MPYAIRLPDGTLVQNIPDDLPPEQAKQRIIAAGLIKPATVPGPPPVAESPLISKAKEYLPPAAVETIQQFTDIPVGFQRGVTQGIRMLSDVFGANNAVSQALRRNEETLTSLMSAQARNDQQEVSRILKEAEDKGTLDQVKAGVKAFTVAPVDTLVSALGTAAPAIVGALGAKVLGAGTLIGTGVSALTGAAMGTGAVKGTIYEETKQALINAGATEQEAEKRAQLAQEYGGKNLDQILLGTAIGGVAAVGPLEKGAARMLATRISKNIAAREAAEQAGTTGLRGRAVAGVAEALPEAGQAAQEQIAANIAQQREGLDVPTFRGAVSSATMEGLAGAGLGATLGRPGAKPEPAAVTEETPIEKARREAEAIAPPAPAPEAAAPPVEEPIVRKPGEPAPLPETLDDATIRSIGFTRGKIRDALLGKAITDPEIRTVLEEYKQRPNASAKTAAKIDAFLARLPEAAAPEPAPVAPPPVVEAPTPPTVPPVEEPVGEAPAPAPITPAQTTSLKTGETIAIETQASPESFSSLVRAQFGEPKALIAKDKSGAEIGRLTYMPGGGPIDVFVREENRRRGVATALYDAFEAQGGKLPDVESGVAISDEARALRASRDQKRTEAPSVPTATTEPAPSGAGPGVAGGPPAVTPAAGVGGAEPTGVVPAAPDVGQPPRREKAAPAPVAATPAPKPAALPEYTEEDIDRAVATGLMTEEQAETYRAELREEEAPPTAMGAAFEKQVADIKAQMDALRQKNGKPPASKSKNRAKYDELQAQLDALTPKEEGDLIERLEKIGATGVVGTRGERPIIDLDALRENLIKARAAPRLQEAILTYIGVDKDGNYLPTTYSREEAAEMAGLGRSSGANVTRTAQALGITADVVSRFHAGQTDIIVRGKNVSEAGTGATDLQPTRGVLYEAPTKGKAGRAAGFLRGALTSDGKLDFSNVPLNSKKATKDSPAVTGLAEIYARASNYDPKRGNNEEVIKQLNAEIAARTKADRKGMQSALDRAYRVVRAEEEAAAEQAETERVAEEGVEVEEAEAEAEDKTRRLSDEEVESEARTTSPAYPEIEPEEAKRIEDQIRGKSLVEAAEFVAKYFKVGDQKTIAQRVVDRLRRMEAAGFNFNLVLVEPGVKAPTSVAVGNANGLSHLKYEGGMPKVTVYLRSVEIGTSGINPRIMLHEFLHAATQAAIHLGNMRGAAGTSTAKFTSDLIDLQNAFIKHFNQRVNDSKAGKTSLTEMEEAILKRNVNAGLDPDELLAWGLTNPKFQQYLETIPYKARTAWTAFVDSVRSFLGLAPRMDTALSELLHVSDDILNGDPYEEIALSKRIFGAQTAQGPQAPAVTAQAEKAAADVDVIGEQEPTKPISGNPAVKARIRIANNMAGLQDKFVEWYSGALRTTSGFINPSVLLSRALDSDRISVEAQLIGGLKKDDGLIVATELTDENGDPVLGADGKPLSYKNVVARIVDAAKKAKKPYAEYLKTIDTLLYGHREYNVRKNNEMLEQQAQALEAAGNKAEADKLREEIATLAIKDPKKLDALEEAFQKDDFVKGISADLDTIRFNFIDMLVDTGRISKEAAQEWKDNEGYIPFKRVQDYTDAFDDAGSSRRGVGATRNIKKFKGSTRQSTSVVENFSSLLDWATGEAMRNEARNRALEDMTLMGAAKRGGKPSTDSPGGVQDTYENGERKQYYVPDPMLMIGFGMQPYEMSRLTKALNKYGTRVLRAGVTTMPPFAIKQVFDDISRAYAFAGVKNNVELTKNILFNFPKNWVNEIFRSDLFKTPKGQANVKELRKLGIVATFDLSRENNVKDVMIEAKAKKESLFNTVLRVMEAGAKASDISVRQAIYNQVLKETGDKVKAESAAREIINFSYQGSMKEVRFISSVVPFFNAYAQGMDKLATAAAGKVVGQTTGTARSMFYTRMTYLTAMGFAYALMMQDDEEYNKLEDHVRDTNWIIPGAKINGMPVGIPVAADLAFFFKAIPERVVRYYKYQGTKEERAAVDLAAEMFVRGYDVFSPPNATPQLLRPIIENSINYSFFLGRPLESQAQLRLRPFQRVGMGTSDAMKSVAEMLENAANATGVEAFAVSPIKLENAVRGLLGTAGGIALSAADMMINPDRTDRPLHQQLSTQLTGASAVLKNPVGTKYMDEIYSLEKKSEQVYNTYSGLLKNSPEKVDKFLRDNLGMYSIRPAVQAIMGAIRTLNETAMSIDKNKAMSPEERREAIDKLRVEQNKIARQVYALRKQAFDIQMGVKSPK